MSMSDMMENPLGIEPKREKSGSYTYRKYNYQYHWAFCKMLSEHAEGNEYAVFIEEHEDITLSNSLNVEIAEFELNQVKETAKKHTAQSLTKIVKKDGFSILGKLASGSSNKAFSDKISNLNFVSTGGYSFDLKKKCMLLEVIKVGDLSSDDLEKIRGCFVNEAGSDDMLSKLAFVVPDLPAKGFDDVVEGRISKLINSVSPGCKYNSGYIYDCVIRDLSRKGENSFDYGNWDEALKKKAVTSTQLDEIICQHVSRKPDESLTAELVTILKDEYGLSSLKRRGIINSFNRYYIRRLSDRNQELEKVSKEICFLIHEYVNNFSDASSLELKIRDKMCEGSIQYFSSKEEFTGAFLFELLVD